MRDPAGLENLYVAAGGAPSSCRVLQERTLKPLTGKTLAEVAQVAQIPEETARDLVVEDESRVARATSSRRKTRAAPVAMSG